MVDPSISKTAFSCPHCSAYTTQHWYELSARYINQGEKIPRVPSEKFSELVARDPKLNTEVKKSLAKWAERMRSVEVFLAEKSETQFSPELHNLFVSQCYHCQMFAVWRGQFLIYPNAKTAPMPNADLPDDIKQDFEEARDTVKVSPRGAAALLRLCIQKLTKHLGEKGKENR